jgi:hypothetical protein
MLQEGCKMGASSSGRGMSMGSVTVEKIVEVTTKEYTG